MNPPISHHQLEASALASDAIGYTKRGRAKDSFLKKARITSERFWSVAGQTRSEREKAVGEPSREQSIHRCAKS
jgi:hypothetical protein